MSVGSLNSVDLQFSCPSSPLQGEIVRKEIDVSQFTTHDYMARVTGGQTIVTNSTIRAEIAPDTHPDSLRATPPSSPMAEPDNHQANASPMVQPNDSAGAVPQPPAPNVQTVGTTEETEPKRKRYRYSGKKLLAGSMLFSVNGTPVEGVNGFLVGVIVECPNRVKNGGRFRVDWTKHSIGMPPTVDRQLLRSWYPNDDATKELFHIAIDEYNKVGAAGIPNLLRLSFPGNPLAATPTTGVAAGATATQQQEDPIVAATPIRFYARASLMTAADSLSTLTHSNRDQEQQVATRSTRSNQSSVADSTTDDGTLDEEDNAWVSIPEIVNLEEMDEDSDDGSLTDNDDKEWLKRKSNNEAPGAVAELVKNIIWNFEVVDGGKVLGDLPQPYDGPSGLRPGVAESFSTPTECFEICGGFTPQFVRKLCAETNDYFHVYIKPKCDKNLTYCKEKWVNVDEWEMKRFFGIMLKISLKEQDGGGYTAYFRNEDWVLHTGHGTDRKTKVIGDSKGWASKYMSLNRFKQIRGAFHPMNKVAGYGGDKCYQLRQVLNQLNVASKATFVPSGNLTFDEGGVGCRSRLCPVRQYNKDKPQKFRVDFFILADAKSYAIYHMDVYQGKNPAENYIHPTAKGLPPTQKAVVNAVMETGIANDSTPMNIFSRRKGRSTSCFQSRCRATT